MSDIRRKKVINELMVENGGSLSAAMRKAGYNKSYAKNPQKLRKTKAFQKEIKPILERLEEERDQALERAKKTRSKAKYRDLIDSTEKLTKLIQLLSGRPTENISLVEYLKNVRPPES
jgi:uncharacterized protein with von Willebrand factor type A (vWA) domain